MNILVFAEQRNSTFKKSAYEVVKAASNLLKEKSGEVTAVVIGNIPEQTAATLGGYDASNVVLVNDPKLEMYSSSGYAKVIAEIVEDKNISTILLSATSMGKELAPCIAAKLDGALAPDCIDIHWDADNLIARRPVYAGKALIDVEIQSANKVFSLRPNVFNAGESNGTICPVEIYQPNISEEDVSTRVIEMKTSSGKIDVAEASIIVSGGRGMQGPENFNLIEELADVLHAATGASRAVVDAGWRQHAEQVGQTGKTVSPTMYVACGISGAIQHLAGMSSSKVIVAINKDKDAPIFQVADYGIAGDVFEILPALTSELRKYFGN